MQSWDVTATPGKPTGRTLSRWGFFYLPPPQLLPLPSVFPLDSSPLLKNSSLGSCSQAHRRDSTSAVEPALKIILKNHPLFFWPCPVGMVVLVTVELQWLFYTCSGTTGEGMSSWSSPFSALLSCLRRVFSMNRGWKQRLKQGRKLKTEYTFFLL